MSPRQLSAFIEHGEALDRMQDARDLSVGLLAQSGNEKEITKHFKAWSNGRSPGAKNKNHSEQMSEAELAAIMKFRESRDEERKKDMPV